MTDESHDEVDTALQGTNAEVVTTLVASHRRFLEFVEKRVGNRATAEEILQEAFLRGVERSGTLRSEESATAWFYRVLRNAIVDHHRRGASATRATGELDREQEPAAPDAETENEICRCVLGLADTLEPTYAAALKRVDLDGIAVQDFAAEAGITANNASVRLFRARAALRQRVVATCRTCADHGCLDCTCRSAGR